MLDRMRRSVWGLSGRLIASYIFVTLAVVVLVEALVLGFQVPSLVNGAQLQAQVDATEDGAAARYRRLRSLSPLVREAMRHAEAMSRLDVALRLAGAR